MTRRLCHVVVFHLLRERTVQLTMGKGNPQYLRFAVSRRKRQTCGFWCPPKPNAHKSVAVCTCWCAHVLVCARVGVTTRGLCAWGPEVNFGHCFSGACSLVFETGSLTGLGSLITPSWLASEPRGSAHLCLTSAGYSVCRREAWPFGACAGRKTWLFGLARRALLRQSPLAFSGLRESNPTPL